MSEARTIRNAPSRVAIVGWVGTAAVALLVWFRMDWNVYVWDRGVLESRAELPVWVQAVASAVAGLVVRGVGIAAVRLARHGFGSNPGAGLR